MAIVFNENKRTFSLHTAKTTYQLKIGNLNYVKHLYYGTTIEDEEARAATVIVPNDQLSLAIGNKGQNAKLAAKLTGYKIDIKPQYPDPEPESEDADAEGYEIMQDAAELDSLDGGAAEV